MNNDTPFDRFLAAVTPYLGEIELQFARRFQDPQLAEEIVCGCLTALYLQWQLETITLPVTQVRTWFRTRVQWRLLDELRRRNHLRPLVDETGDEDEPAGYVVAIDEGARRERDATRQLVWEALDGLSDEDRRIVESHYYDEATDQETGTRVYGEADGTRAARGLRVWRRRKAACAHLHDLLVEQGLTEDDCTPLATQAV